MSEQTLDDHQVRTTLQEACCEVVTQHVRCDSMASDASSISESIHHPLHGADPQSPPIPVQQQGRAFVSVPTITFSAPHRDDRSSLRREEDQSVLVALPAADSGTQIRDVNVLKVQFTELTDSNPGVEEDGGG